MMTDYKLVPVEPTREMLVAARDWSHQKYGKPIGNDAATGCWQSMLSAAPRPDDEAAEMTDWIVASAMEQARKWLLIMLGCGVVIGLLIAGIVWWLL